ncbi:MAG TPA: SbcC/MukB-like Walker B domain-containing protein [Spirochaetota bacterium]|nr:SbcC/MukB-like Walker B domain-containing protein [Spirochaetota bacterium]HOM38591.1 SbcC/MukB-like Walker B domain-containing protein [Spirochaetota bacterium]HPQ49728.1 SbcC/MukB-like Walker B domain-containing protein [Spirochaetota bacterium]
MRIDKLTIQNFGPFKDKQEINFKDLDFFCIEGENGSGKSTIIDAIFFCLWGESLKGISHSEIIFKAPDEKNHENYFLELDFLIEDKKLKIIKSKKLNVLKIDNEEFKGREIEKKLEKMGFYKDMMKKSFIIKQGAFESVISSGKEEYRTPIINTIFGDLIKRIQENVKSKIEKVEKNIEEINKEINNVTLILGVNEYEEIKEEKIEEEIISNTEKLKTCENKISSINTEISKIRKKREELIIKNKDIKEIIEKFKINRKIKEKLEKEFKGFETEKIIYPIYKKYLDKKDDLSRLKAEINDLEINVKTLEETLKNEENKRKNILSVKENIKNLYSENEQKIKQYNKKTREIEIEIRELEKNILELKKEKDKFYNLIIDREKNKSIFEKNRYDIKNKIEIKTKEIKEIKSYSEKLKKEFENYNNFYEQNKEIFEEFKKNHDEINGKIISLKEQKYKLEEKIEKEYPEFLSEKIEIKDYNSLVEKIKKQIVCLEKKYKENLVLEIKSSLKDNDICPVCGSIFHKKNDISINKSENEEFIKLKYGLEKLKLIEKDIENIKIYDNEIRKLEKEKKIIITQSKEILKKIGLSRFSEVENKVKEIKNSIEKFTKKENDIENELTKLEADLKINEININTIEKEIENNKKENLKIEEKIKEKENSVRLLEYEKINIEKEINIIIDKLNSISSKKFSTIEEIENWLINESEKSIKKIEEELEKIRSEIEENKKELNIKYGAKKTIEEDIEKIKNEIEEKGKTIGETIYQIEKNLKNINEFDKKNEEYEKIINEISINESIIEQKSFLYNLNHDIEDFLKESTALEEEISKIDQNILSIEKDLDYYKRERDKTEDTISKLKDGIKLFKEISKKYEKYKKDRSIYSQIYKDLESDKLPKYIAYTILKNIINYVNNELLSKVLNGRYLLSIDENKDKINVYDNVLRTIRVTDSLSGGEKFLLSFILALGFSKIIGQKIGIFFIDEGFGTLDDNNRRLIVELFNDIKKIESGRQIGIITHMKDISSFFTQKILVEKESDGKSTIKQIS